MALIADGLMIVASLVAAIYCIVLSKRVHGLSNLDQGLGAAIAGLSRQVDGMQGALEQAKRVSGASVRELREMTAKAEAAAGRLELLLAALHAQDGARPLDPELRAAARNAATVASGTAATAAPGTAATAAPPREDAGEAPAAPRPSVFAEEFAALPEEGDEEETLFSEPESEPEPEPEPESEPEPEPDARADAGPGIVEEAPGPDPELPEPVAQERSGRESRAPLPASEAAEEEDGELALAPPPDRPVPETPAAESLRNALRDLLGRKET
ncbi:hypothetical protein [Oceanicella sp. SM1341]|uniref:hypothetical protein n=1 Tax=Oceanicella sp. SM1341 TaxID=1548889 RepID=UPI000E4D8603|nr:hypothetical protein [Oceanicella sp. SM1341]